MRLRPGFQGFLRPHRPLRLHSLILSIVLALSGALLLPGCRQLIPGISSEEDIALRTYRDTLLDLDLGYPEGWTFTEKKSVSSHAATHDLAFEPQNTLWTRRFLVKVMIPHRLPDDRTLEDFKAEYLARLAAAGDNVRLADTGAAVLGGVPAFRARYATVMNGKPFTRHTDYLCLRGGRDVSLAFEVADDHAEEDIELYRRIAERFRFDST
jgi:hypothetical protein